MHGKILNLLNFYMCFSNKNITRVPDSADIMKAMEVDGHKTIMLKSFANISENMIIKKREVENFVDISFIFL